MLMMLWRVPLVLVRWVKQKVPDAADAGACSPLFGALGETERP